MKKRKMVRTDSLGWWFSGILCARKEVLFLWSILDVIFLRLKIKFQINGLGEASLSGSFGSLRLTSGATTRQSQTELSLLEVQIALVGDQHVGYFPANFHGKIRPRKILLQKVSMFCASIISAGFVGESCFPCFFFSCPLLLLLLCCLARERPPPPQ